MIEQHLLRLLEQGHTLALVTIIDKQGSAPRLPGSKMIVGPDAILHGTIGGGRMEHMAAGLAQDIARGADPVLREFDLRGSDDSDMVCGGVQLILIERVTPAMSVMFRQAVDCAQAGGRGLWLIDISVPERPVRRFFDLDREPPVIEGLDPAAVFRCRATRLIRHGRQTLVLDPLPGTGTVILFGGGHVAMEVAFLADYAGFEVIVCDDRRECTDPARFSMAREIHLVDFSNVFRDIHVRGELYLLILTRSHSHDREVLGQALQRPARYIGMIGSRKKRDLLYANLRRQGVSDADLARVHCPVGLSIGSETPREIALAIVAELVAARAGVL